MKNLIAKNSFKSSPCQGGVRGGFILSSFKKFLTCLAAGFLFLLNCASAQTIVEYTIPTSSSQPKDITTGGDGSLWFAESAGNKIGKVTTGGVFTEYTVPTTSSQPSGIAAGPDGNLWFTETTGNKIGKVTTSGVFTEYTVPTTSSQPSGIAAGPDGNLWFTENIGNKIGKITTGGVFTEYTVPTSSSQPVGIVLGPDNNLWFAELYGNKIGKITTIGTFTEYVVPTVGSYPFGITQAQDGNLWFTELMGNKIGRVTTSGSFAEYAIPTSSAQPRGVKAGPDGNLWFAEYGGNKIGKSTTGGSIMEYSIPTASSAPFNFTTGPDGNLWFTENGANKIGVLYLPYSETPSVGTGSNTGLISPNTTQTVILSANRNFTLSAIAPYTNITVGGTCGGTRSGNIFTTYPATKNCTVIANFYRPNTAPVITSSNSTTFVAGTPSSFTVIDTGYPEPSLAETGALPPGMQFNATTGIISGTPNATGSYPIQLIASNGAGTATQNFTITVLPVTLQSLSVTSTVSTPEPNQRVQLKVMGLYSDGSQSDLTYQIDTLLSTNMEVARPIGNTNGTLSGRLYTRDPGVTKITAKLGGVTGSLNLTVSATSPYLQNITLSSPTSTLGCGVGQQTNITAIGTYSDGSKRDVTNQILPQLRSSNSSVGVIYPNTTIVQGRETGNFTVIGALYTRLATLNMNVTAPTLKKGEMGAMTDMCIPNTVPVVTGLTPKAGPLLDAAHAPTITIHGTDLMPEASVKLGTGNPIQCQPNDSSTNCTYIDNETLQLKMPLMTVPGPVEITVTNPDGTESVPMELGANTYTVSSLSNLKTFVEEESNVQEVANGPTLGGTGVVLTGIFPAKGTPIEVDFDGIAADIASVDSTTRITANTPAHREGIVNVTLYEKNGDGTKTLLGTLANGYEYRAQRCTLGNGALGTIDQCVTEIKACVYVPTAPASTKRISVTGHLVTNNAIVGGAPQCVDALPKFDDITIPVEGTYPTLFCTTSHSPLVANRTETPSAACAATASNAGTPNLTMMDLSYRESSGTNTTEEHALIVPLTWEDRVSLIAGSGEAYQGVPSMQLGASGYVPQRSSNGFCVLKDLPQTLPAPIANQNFCVNAGLYTQPLGATPWTLQTIADQGSFVVVDAGGGLV